MDAQYSRMQEFRDYMSLANAVGEKITTEVPYTNGINIIAKDIEHVLYPVQNKPKDDSETLKNIAEILENKFSSGKIRQKCPEIDEDRQVPCIMEQLYLTALRLEALKHYEISRKEKTCDETNPIKSSCEVFTTTSNLIRTDYNKLVENGVEFNKEIIKEIDGLYRKDTQEFFETNCTSLEEIMSNFQFK